MPHSKSVADVDEIANVVGELFEIFMFGLIAHSPMPDKRAKPGGKTT